MQILDLRQVSSRSLEPLFVEEARQWRDELHWDYRPSLELIRKFIDSRALRGAVVMEDDRPAGYGFYVLEERKGLIGGLFVAPHASEPEITRALLQEMLETLWATPRIERVEAQLMPFGTSQFIRRWAPSIFHSTRIGPAGWGTVPRAHSIVSPLGVMTISSEGTSSGKLSGTPSVLVAK